MKKRILHLTLYKEYFGQIAAGKKKNEYRKATPYWIKRLEGKEFDEVHFRNGYSKRSPYMIVEWKETVRQDTEIFGGDTFVIALGRILSINLYDKLK